MKQSLFTDLRKKMLTRACAISLGAIVLFYAAVCTPVYLWAGSDILIAGSVFPIFWDTLMSICNYLFYWIAISFVSYAIFRFGIGKCKPFFICYAVISTVRYFANHLAGCFVTGFQSVNDFFAYYFRYILLDIVLDLALMFVVVLVIHGITKPFLQNEHQHAEFFKESLPMTHLFDLHNAMSKTTLLAAIVPAAFKMGSRLIYDIALGGPTGFVDLLWMITFYVFDVLSVAIGYVIMVFFINKIYFSEQKAKNEFEQAE